MLAINLSCVSAKETLVLLRKDIQQISEDGEQDVCEVIVYLLRCFLVDQVSVLDPADTILYCLLD